VAFGKVGNEFHFTIPAHGSVFFAGGYIVAVNQASALCPICKGEMTGTPYKVRNGVKYECWGSEASPHKVRAYVDFPGKVKPVEEAPARPVRLSESARALRERVGGHLGRKGVTE